MKQRKRWLVSIFAGLAALGMAFAAHQGSAGKPGGSPKMQECEEKCEDRCCGTCR